MTTHETGRVLHVMASGARGGGAAHILDLLPELRRIGWDCQAAVGSDGPLASELEALGVPVHPLDLMGRRLGFGRVREAVRLMRTARSLQADVVHIHGTRAAFFHAAARAAVREGPERPSVVYTAHGLAYRKEAWAGERVVSLLAERIACRGADAVMSVSRADLDDLERRGFLGRRPGFHVRNAVRLSEEAGPRRAEARRRLGLPSDGPVVGTVSRLVPQKAVDDLIEAAGAAQSIRSADGPPITLVVVGDGPLRSELERRISAEGAAVCGAGVRVMLLGTRDDVPDVLPAFDLFVLSSRWEGEPIALLEAMAAGLPCVATETAGAREILGGSPEAGRLTPVGDAGALGRVIADLIGDRGTAEALGAGARELMRTRTPRAQALRVAEIYRSLRPAAGAAGP
ncbi:MAG: glycosyltransferase [Acidobacteria bacterium]|nr:glycosyltransferase [Acidobacteriota bacterium]